MTTAMPLMVSPIERSYRALPQRAPVAPIDGTAFGRLVWLADRRALPGALLEAAREARTVIKADLQLLRGPEGQALARMLASRARQGLRVQVLAWGTPSAGLDAAIATARSQGLAVRQIAGTRGAGALIADDRTAFLAPALQIGGEAARELGRVFNQAWAQAGGTPASLPTSGLGGALAPETLSAVKLHAFEGAARLAAAIDRARRTIALVADELGGPVVVALQRAQARGVAVRVLAGSELAKRAGAIATLQKAGATVAAARPSQAAYAVIDGDTLVYGSAADAFLLEARGGRALTVIQADFNLAFERAEMLAAPSLATHAAERLHGLGTALGAAEGRLVAPLKALLGLHVGVVKLAGRYRVITEVR